MLKSIAAVVGSYLLSIFLVVASDPLLSRLFPGDFVRGRVPSTTPLLASTGVFIAVSIFCAFLCARFAPSRPARHVLWFLIVGEVLGGAATVANWNAGWPHWYGLAWLLSWPLSCWIGLLLRHRAQPQSSAASA